MKLLFSVFMICLIIAFAVLLNNIAKSNNASNNAEACATRWEGLETKMLIQNGIQICMIKVDELWRPEKNVQITITK